VHSHQKEVAQGMVKVAKEMKPEFILSLGDNFYYSGVSSNMKKAEKRFQKTFEDVYSDAAIAGVPWYVIAGNHDHYGSVESQIEYTHSPQNTNSRWQYPSLYHKQTFSKTVIHDTAGSSSTVTVDVLLIDTTELCSSHLSLFRSSPEFSKDHDAMQWSWIEENMDSSQADYLLVVGHYPVYNTGEAFGAIVREIQCLLPVGTRSCHDAYYNQTNRFIQRDHQLYSFWSWKFVL